MQAGWHPLGVPLVDLIDETFIVADPQDVAARLLDERVWRRWWPDRRLVVFMDRGAAGVRWTVTGDLVGSCEVWLEPFADGVIVHYFLRADPTRRGSETEPVSGSPARLARRSTRVRIDEAMTWKALLNVLKDELEANRPVGEKRDEPHVVGIKEERDSAEG